LTRMRNQFELVHIKQNIFTRVDSNFVFSEAKAFISLS
jgi:hypothetical protein